MSRTCASYFEPATSVVLIFLCVYLLFLCPISFFVCVDCFDMLGAYCRFVMHISSIMEPKTRNAAIREFNRRLRDENSNNDHLEESN